MLYAFGEILILIIGILFALKVNNWNLKQHNKAIEISILKSMKTELESDLEYISVDVKIHGDGIAASQIILDHLEKNLPYNDSLAVHFLNTTITTILIYKHGAYETLQSLGVSLISNEILRSQIIDLYAQYEVIIRVERNNTDKMTYAENNIFNSRFDQLYKYEQNLPVETSYGEMIPLDYEGLKTDDEYKYFLKTYRNINIMNLEWFYSPTKDLITLLILGIEEELIELEK